MLNNDIYEIKLKAFQCESKFDNQLHFPETFLQLENFNKGFFFLIFIKISYCILVLVYIEIENDL